MNWKQLYSRKSVDILLAEMAGEHRLRRVLGPVALTSLGVGAIIGAGIFVMTGRAAAVDAGPAVIVSYIVAGIGCTLAAFCYAEFAALAPVAGSAYTYAYATLGELVAWIIGWDLILEYAMACACVASAWAKYFNELLIALELEPVAWQLCNDPFSRPGAWLNLPAMLVTLAVTVVLVVGIRESAGTNALLVLVKLAVVLFVVFVGFAYVNSLNWTSVPVEHRLPKADEASSWGMLGLLGINRWLLPIDEHFRSSFFPYGISGMMLGASMVFFAFIGFDSISTHSEEARNPQRDVPIGILASLIICTILYVLVSAVITGMEPYPQIDKDAAIAAAFRKRAEATGSGVLQASAGLIATGALAGMTSVLLITFLSQARIFLAMARDGLLPPAIFAAVHPRFRTPHLSTMLTGGVISLVAAFTPILKLEQMVNIGTLMAFIIVCATVLVLRIQHPHAKRPFRCPAIWLVAPAGVGVNLLMTLFLPPETWLRLIVWLVAGLLLYAWYGHRHSTVGQALKRELAARGLSPTDAPLDT